jgi:hypothetical protein
MRQWRQKSNNMKLEMRMRHCPTHQGTVGSCNGPSANAFLHFQIRGKESIQWISCTNLFDRVALQNLVTNNPKTCKIGVNPACYDLTENMKRIYWDIVFSMYSWYNKSFTNANNKLKCSNPRWPNLNCTANLVVFSVFWPFVWIHSVIQ